ncbi:hypothetical protein TrST_g6580 [Triparma strigata]|uniref:Uncharacterized protein n=1 Tax=Triparma strigata TaxID=1606541 RepID=A0A9W6ZKV1_9STRA|nr:hypothetical protein TrST_g6580 [Triparma strigata]
MKRTVTSNNTQPADIGSLATPNETPLISPASSISLTSSSCRSDVCLDCGDLDGNFSSTKCFEILARDKKATTTTTTVKKGIARVTQLDTDKSLSGNKPNSDLFESLSDYDEYDYEKYDYDEYDYGDNDYDNYDSTQMVVECPKTTELTTTSDPKSDWKSGLLILTQPQPNTDELLYGTESKSDFSESTDYDTDAEKIPDFSRFLDNTEDLLEVTAKEDGTLRGPKRQREVGIETASSETALLAVSTSSSEKTSKRRRTDNVDLEDATSRGVNSTAPGKLKMPDYTVFSGEDGPKRSHGKEYVVRHLLLEGNAVEDIPIEKVAEKQPDFPDFSPIVGEEIAKTVYKGEDEQYYFLVDCVPKSIRELCLREDRDEDRKRIEKYFESLDDGPDSDDENHGDDDGNHDDGNDDENDYGSPDSEQEKVDDSKEDEDDEDIESRRKNILVNALLPLNRLLSARVEDMVNKWHNKFKTEFDTWGPASDDGDDDGNDDDGDDDGNDDDGNDNQNDYDGDDSEEDKVEDSKEDEDDEDIESPNNRTLVANMASGDEPVLNIKAPSPQPQPAAGVVSEQNVNSRSTNPNLSLNLFLPRNPTPLKEFSLKFDCDVANKWDGRLGVSFKRKFLPSSPRAIVVAVTEVVAGGQFEDIFNGCYPDTQINPGRLYLTGFSNNQEVKRFITKLRSKEKQACELNFAFADSDLLGLNDMVRDTWFCDHPGCSYKTYHSEHDLRRHKANRHDIGVTMELLRSSWLHCQV